MFLGVAKQHWVCRSCDSIRFSCYEKFTKLFSRICHHSNEISLHQQRAEFNTSVAIKKYINQNCSHLFVQLCKSKTHLTVKRQLNAEKNSLVSFSSVKERAGGGQDKADGCDFFVGISLFKLVLLLPTLYSIWTDLTYNKY